MAQFISPEILTEFCINLFTAVGCQRKDAEIISEILIDAELDGVTTHGISMLPAHVRKFQKKSYNVSGQITIANEGSAFAVLNADNIIGLLSAHYAMQMAIDKAKTSGIAIVLCNHANTFGAAAYYAKMAVKADVLGIIMSNAPAQMAPLGGREKLLGTNPLAIGIPSKEGSPFIFDMATSIVAKSKINEAVRKKKAFIPNYWATDLEGQPTSDPLVAVKGLLLPMAGAKGYGLCIAIDMIAGVLAQAAFLNDVVRFYPIENGLMNVGHVFIVLNPYVLSNGNIFLKNVDSYLQRIRNSQRVNSGNPIYVPGDRRRINHSVAKKEGISIDERLLYEFKKISQELNVDMPFKEMTSNENE